LFAFPVGHSTRDNQGVFFADPLAIIGAIEVKGELPLRVSTATPIKASLDKIMRISKQIVGG
jgi:hypothetical protein